MPRKSAHCRHTASTHSAQNPANGQQTFGTKVGIQSAHGTPCGSKHIPTEALKKTVKLDEKTISLDEFNKLFEN